MTYATNNNKQGQHPWIPMGILKVPNDICLFLSYNQVQVIFSHITCNLHIQTLVKLTMMLEISYKVFMALNPVCMVNKSHLQFQKVVHIPESLQATPTATSLQTLFKPVGGGGAKPVKDPFLPRYSPTDSDDEDKL